MENIKTLSVCCPKCGGVIQSQDSQWKCLRCSFWISALDEMGKRRGIAELEKKALEAGGKRKPLSVADEAPSVILDSFLSPPSQPPPLPERPANSAGGQSRGQTPDHKSAPKVAQGHPNYVEGDGSRAFPFVIHTSNTLRSAEVQREIIDGIYGQGTKNSASRFYYESQRGLPGNGDLCEHKFTLNGEQVSVWFDLYLVTRLMNDPELNRAKREMMSELSKNPEFVRLQNEMRQKLGLPVQQRPKGCLGVVALLVGVFGLFWSIRLLC